MASVELATAYVNLVASAKGLGQSIASSLSSAGGEGEKAGAAAGSGFGKKFGAGLAGVGLAAGAALGKAVFAGIDAQAANAKLGAQLGVTGPESARLGKVAGSLYAANYGDSLGGVNDSIKSVINNIGGMGKASDADLAAITGQVSSLASTFDQDLGGTTAAVGQLMKSGLAKNATEALDIITSGFQNGVDKSGDYLDTLNEYGVQFSKLGIDGKTATGLLSQGLKGGARDADLVADAFKEFSIRAVDGSTASAAGFKALGLDAGTMGKAIGKGGKSAADATQLVLTKMQAIKDPVAKAAAATALFGTQSEDLGKALNSLDLKTASTGMGNIAGAAAKVDKAVGGTLQSQLGGLKRTFSTAFIDAGTAILPALGPAIDGLGQLFAKMGPAITTAVSVIGPIFANIGATIGPIVATVFGALGPIITNLGSAFTGLAPILGQLHGVMSPVSLLFAVLQPILPQLAAALGQVATILGGILQQAFAALVPIVTTVVGVVGN